MKLPGAAWALLISGLSTAILGFLSGDWFAGQAWIPIIMALVAALAKWAETQVSPPPVRQVGGQRAPSTLTRILFGG